MPSNVFQRGKRFGARVTNGGRQVWLGTFDTQEAAEAAVASVQGGRSPGGGTVESWWEAWPLIATGRRKRTEETIARTARLSMPFVEEFGPMLLAAVPKIDAVLWAQNHPSHARYARTVLADAVWAGALEKSPLAGVYLPAPEQVEIVRLEPEEVERLAAQRPDDIGPLILICAFSGLRLSEGLALEARDLTGDLLHVRSGKGGKEAHAVLFEPGLSAFRALAPARGRLFPEAWDRNFVWKRWRYATEVVGTQARFHDLRHFHAVWLLERGVDRAAVAAQLRHAGLRDVDRYLSTREPLALLDRVRMIAS